MLEEQTKKTRFITCLNELLKHKTTIHNLSFDSVLKVANSSIKKGYLNGEAINRVIFYLRSKGCEWSTTLGGGCFMCGHFFGTTRGTNLPKNAFYMQFLDEFKKYDFTQIPMLCIYNAGSILNDKELPRKELYQIFEVIEKEKSIKCVILESRPEFVDDEVLTAIQDILKEKRIEIGIGLETTNDKIRDYCINKGFSFTDYLNAAYKIKKYSNIKLLTYLTVKPLFLSTNEAIKDCLSSIEKIKDTTDVISLEPLSVQKGTLVEYLYNSGTYELPKGWMIRDILLNSLEMLHTLPFELRLGGFEFYPIPEHFVANCTSCNQHLYWAIEMYNATKDATLLKELTCQCYEAYKKTILSDSMIEKLNIEERISTVLANLMLKIEDSRRII